jgi:hypothetical protein
MIDMPCCLWPGGIVAQGFKTAETLKLWNKGTILYSIQHGFQTLEIYTGKATGGKKPIGYDSGKTKFAIYLNGLLYTGYPAHMTITPGPDDTDHWRYFHFTTDVLVDGGGSHAFFEVTDADPDANTVKFSGSNQVVAAHKNDDQKGTLTKPHEHNQDVASNPTLLKTVSHDLELILREMVSRDLWED